MRYIDPDFETQVTLIDIAQLIAPETRHRRQRSAALQALLDKCPEHLFSTDDDELKSLH